MSGWSPSSKRVSAARSGPFWAAVALLVSTACGERTSAPGSDAGWLLPRSRDALVVPDVFVPQPPVESCDATDLVAQRECGLGRKCTIQDDQFRCTQAGDIGRWSPCDADQDQCEAGALCASPGGSGDPVCLPFCMGRWRPCDDGVCAGQTSSAAERADVHLCLPATECDPVGQTGCPTGFVCVWDPRFGDTTVCIAESRVGSSGPGSPCSLTGATYPCAASNACVTNFRGQDTCRKICVAASGDGCGQDEQCSAIGTGTYGYCVGGGQQNPQTP